MISCKLKMDSEALLADRCIADRNCLQMVNLMVNHHRFSVEFREMLGDGEHIFCSTSIWLLELYICYLISEESIIGAYPRRFHLLLNVDLLLSSLGYVYRNGSTISASAFEAMLDSLVYSQVMILDLSNNISTMF
ncbi:hypothetical protein O6H91_03G024900 [Diphasiastrum complanatum]|uniref:Uncharacterized protein n=1 Tax=Diphasiastrum complanatum TaxID=34168 RepID=A0ACC2E4C7_DIPCM|nr:hypothetical protein O6H91_03G024900 [Diphasiastrum complanatum]